MLILKISVCEFFSQLWLFFTTCDFFSQAVKNFHIFQYYSKNRHNFNRLTFQTSIPPPRTLTYPLTFHEEYFSLWREILKKFCFKVNPIFSGFLHFSWNDIVFIRFLVKITPRGLVKFIQGAKNLRKLEKIAFFEETPLFQEMELLQKMQFSRVSLAFSAPNKLH